MDKAKGGDGQGTGGNYFTKQIPPFMIEVFNKNKSPLMNLSSVSAKTKIRHKNDINTTLSRMPLASRRVLFMAIAQVNPKKLMEKGQVFRIYATEYAKIANIDTDTAYAQLSAAAKDLQKQVIGIPKDQLLPLFRRAGEPLLEKPTGTGIRMLNVTEWCDYEEGNGYIDISFTRQMEPYICRIERDFTTQVLLSTARLRDTNASNFYQLIRRKIGEKRGRYFDIGVDELKDELELFTLKNREKIYSYPLFKDFNKFVIKKSLDTINDTTEIKDLQVQIIERRQRKATRLRFTFRVDDQMTFDGF
jgi:plasmid replication initiation protein